MAAALGDTVLQVGSPFRGFLRDAPSIERSSTLLYISQHLHGRNDLIGVDFEGLTYKQKEKIENPRSLHQAGSPALIPQYISGKLTPLASVRLEIFCCVLYDCIFALNPVRTKTPTIFSSSNWRLRDCISDLFRRRTIAFGFTLGRVRILCL